MRSDIAWVPQLASEGTLLETSKQPWFKAVAAAADPGPLSTNYWNGGYYGLPDDTNTQVFFYNKADFAAANLSPPTTWNEMIPDAKTLTIPPRASMAWASTALTSGTSARSCGPTVAASPTRSSRRRQVHEQQGNGERGPDASQPRQEGVIGSDMVGGSGAISGETGFPKGEYAMYLDGPWAPTTYKDAEFTGYGTSLIPAGPGGSVSVVGGEDLVIAKGGKHLADTIKFVQFLQSPFAQLAMAMPVTWRRTRQTTTPRGTSTQPYGSSPSSSLLRGPGR